MGCFGWYKPTSPPPGSLILVIDPHLASWTAEHITFFFAKVDISASRSSHMKYSSLRSLSSTGWNAASAGGKAKINHP
jgi:hypothetical protein